MNKDTHNPADLPAGEAAPEEAAPKRRRSPAKAAAPVSETAEAPAAEAKPVKPRAPRKTAAAKAAEAAEVAEAPAAAAAVTEEAPAPKRRAPRKAAPAAEAGTSEEPEAPPPAPAPPEPEAPPPAPAPGDAGGGDGESVRASGEEGEGESNEFGDDRGGRGRNRRRGRKGRGEGGEGQPQQGVEGAEGGRAPQRSFEPVEMAVAVEPEVTAAAGELFAEVLAGAFDDGEEPPELAEGEEVADTKRVLAADPDAPKLQKVLAQAGVGSRRDIEDMIAEGKIEVNGEVAHIGQRISFGDRVSVAGKQIRVRITPPAPRILAYHKPVGEVVTFNDPEGRPTVFRRLPRLQNGKWQSVGRLDLNTEGLLLFTNSGELANQLMHPRFGVEREYAVRVLGTLTPEQKARLLEGVEIEGQKAQFKSIEDGGGEGVNHWYRVVITEGRNREVRKLFDKVGLAVSRLMRIRYGTVVLPRGLKRGVWVELGDDDVRVIRRLAGHVRQERGDRNDQQRGDRNEQPRGGDERGPKQRGNDPKQRGNNNRRADGRQAGVGPRPSRPEPAQQRPPEQRFEDRPPRDHNEDDDDFVPRNINPLEQTFDRRFATGSKRIPQGFGAGGSAQDRHDGGRGKGKGDGPREPDPMQTSVGYIGGDAFLRRGGRGGGGGGGGRSGGGGGRSGGGGGGGRSGGGGNFGGRKR